MNTLLILMLIQMFGIVISIVISSYIYTRNKRKTFISKNLLRIGKAHADNWPWLIDYFQWHPESTLKKDFPRLYKIAMATCQYKEIIRLRKEGALSDRSYQKKLKKILSLIDIKAELDVSEYQND